MEFFISIKYYKHWLSKAATFSPDFVYFRLFVLLQFQNAPTSQMTNKVSLIEAKVDQPHVACFHYLKRVIMGKKEDYEFDQNLGFRPMLYWPPPWKAIIWS